MRERVYNPLPLFHMNCQAVTATCVILTAGCLGLLAAMDRTQPQTAEADEASDDEPAVASTGSPDPHAAAGWPGGFLWRRLLAAAG